MIPVGLPDSQEPSLRIQCRRLPRLAEINEAGFLESSLGFQEACFILSRFAFTVFSRLKPGFDRSRTMGYNSPLLQLLFLVCPEISLIQVMADLCHEVVVEPEVVQDAEAHGQHFLGLEEVADVSP